MVCNKVNPTPGQTNAIPNGAPASVASPSESKSKAALRLNSVTTKPKAEIKKSNIHIERAARFIAAQPGVKDKA